MRAVHALTGLRIYTGSPEPLLLDYGEVPEPHVLAHLFVLHDYFGKRAQLFSIKCTFWYSPGAVVAARFYECNEVSRVRTAS